MLHVWNGSSHSRLCLSGLWRSSTINCWRHSSQQHSQSKPCTDTRQLRGNINSSYITNTAVRGQSLLSTKLLWNKWKSVVGDIPQFCDSLGSRPIKIIHYLFIVLKLLTYYQSPCWALTHAHNCHFKVIMMIAQLHFTAACPRNREWIITIRQSLDLYYNHHDKWKA